MSNKKGLPETAPEQQSPLNIMLSQREVLGMLEDASDVELAGPLAKGMINVFIATSGSGKSLLAFLVSWNELKNGQFKKVFYLDLDNPHSIYKDRYSNFPLLDGFFYFTEYIIDKKLDEQFGLFPVEKATTFLSELSKSQYATESLIVIDSLQNFVDYNDLRELKKFFRLLKQFTNMGATVLVLHHKSSKQESPSFKGLSYIKDASDVLWEIVPDIKKNGEISSFRMTCVKNRSTTNFVSFIVSFSTDTGTVNYDQNVLFQEEVPIKEAILSVLKHGSMKQVELVEATKPLVTAGEKRIRSVLSKIVALGLVSVKQVKTAKVYSLNTNNIEPGYFDAMDEQDATLDALPF